MPVIVAKFDPRELGLEVVGYSGEEAICRCPFHDDNSPSASINLYTGQFFCFACGASSNAYAIAKMLNGFVGTATITVRKQSENTEWRRLLSFPFAYGNEYLHGRMVYDNTIHDMHIRAMPTGVIFEVRDVMDQVIGVVVRRYEGKPRYMYFGERTSVWPMQDIRTLEPGSRVFVTEGVFGALRARLAGVPAVSTLGAMAKSTVKFALSSFEPVVLFDNDFAGYLGAARVLKLCPNARAVIPGNEADELSPEEWKALERDALTTRSYRYLARLSGNVKRFYEQLK